MPKKFHHEPAFSGDLTGAIDADGDTVTGDAVVTVLNSQHDSRFKAATYTGSYGSLAITEAGAWVYTLDAENEDVVALPEGDELTDTILVETVYNYRNEKGVNIVITITGVAAPE